PAAVWGPVMIDDEPLPPELQSKLPNPDMQGVPRALLRAARRAREIARQTNTPLIIVRDGVLVEEWLTDPVPLSSNEGIERMSKNLEPELPEDLKSKSPDPDMQGAPYALLRAARRAREIARQTNTLLIIVRDG